MTATQTDLGERVVAVQAREAAVEAREAAIAELMGAAQEVLAAADQRDALADARDLAADRREHELDRAEFLACEGEYGRHLPERRAVVLDHHEAKADRVAARRDLMALASALGRTK